ncbi:MAG: glycosyltransferase family 2 protein [bacterium]
MIENNDIMISVVIPLYNEEESLLELSAQLEKELTILCGERWEVIFVDDGSRDNSYEVIKGIHYTNTKFKAIQFRKNLGKAAALQAGFNDAIGEYIATMDSDLQDDPAELQNMLAKMNEGYDLVSGWKKVRHDPKLTKNLPSKLFNWATSKVAGVKLHDFNCGLKLYRKEVAKSLDVYGEMHRYLPAFANLAGFRVTETPVTHHARKYGKSKYGLSRFINGYLDLLTVIFTTKYSKSPLHFFGLIGTTISMIGFIIDLVLLIEWFMKLTALSNRPIAYLGLGMIVIGIQFVSMGLIGEWILKSNIKQHKNDLVIKEKLRD